MTEQHNLEILPGSKARVAFTISAGDVAQQYSAIVKKYVQTIEVKGFRKGKTPIAVLEKKFGQNFRAESMSELIDTCAKEILPTLEPAPLPYKQPYLCNAAGDESDVELKRLADDFDPKVEFSFSMGFDIAPQLSMPDLTKLDLVPLSAKVAEADIDQVLATLREESAVLMERKDEPAQEDGDIIAIEYALLKEGQTEPETKEKLSGIIRLGEVDDHNFHDHVKELKTNDTVVLSAHEFSSNESLNAAERGYKGDVWVHVKSIRYRILADLDDEFAQDIGEEYQTLDDLKQAKKAELEHELEHIVERYMLTQVYSQLSEQLDFDIPLSLINMYIQNVSERYKQQFGGNEEYFQFFLAMHLGEGQMDKAIIKLRHEGLRDLYGDLLRKRIQDDLAKDWQVSDEDKESELAEAALHMKVSVEELKAKYPAEKLEEISTENALSSKLSRELITLASKEHAEAKREIDKETCIAELKALEATYGEKLFTRYIPAEAEAPAESE